MNNPPEAIRLATGFPDHDVTTPTVDRHEDTITLTYYSPAPTDYETHIYRQTVLFTPDTIVDVTAERIDHE